MTLSSNPSSLRRAWLVWAKRNIPSWYIRKQTSIGIDPIQFGIIVVLNCGIGLLTPPVGSVLFIGSAVAKRPMEKVVKATLPFYLCMFIALLLLTYIPDISLAIPKLLGGYVSPIANPLGPVFIH